MPQKLARDEIERRLGALDGWTLHGDSIRRELRFPDFVAAFGFMTRVALHAEAMGHHPDWSNVYDRVTVELSTHDAGGVTDRDFELAAVVDRLAR